MNSKCNWGLHHGIASRTLQFHTPAVMKLELLGVFDLFIYFILQIYMDVTDTLVNSAYNTALLGGLVFANCFVAEKAFGTKPTNLGKYDIENVGKFTLNLYLAVITKNWVQNRGWLPTSIVPSTNINPTG